MHHFGALSQHRKLFRMSADHNDLKPHTHSLGHKLAATAVRQRQIANNQVVGAASVEPPLTFPPGFHAICGVPCIVNGGAEKLINCCVVFDQKKVRHKKATGSAASSSGETLTFVYFFLHHCC